MGSEMCIRDRLGEGLSLPKIFCKIELEIYILAHSGTPYSRKIIGQESCIFCGGFKILALLKGRGIEPKNLFLEGGLGHQKFFCKIKLKICILMHSRSTFSIEFSGRKSCIFRRGFEILPEVSKVGIALWLRQCKHIFFVSKNHGMTCELWP